MIISNVAAIIWVVAAVNVALAIFVYAMSKARSSKIFFIATISHAVWQSIIGLYISSSTETYATLLVKTAYFSGLIVLILFAYFFYIYPNSEKRYDWVKGAMAATVVAFGILAFGTDTIIGQAYYIGGISQWGWKFGQLWFLFPMFFFGWFLSGMLVMLYKGLHTTDKNVRHGLLFMFWGISILVVVPSILNIVLPQFGMFSLLWLGPILNSAWIILAAYAILKYEALNIQLIAKRAFTYAIVVSGITLITVSINFLDSYLVSTNPGFPVWSLYFISALIISGMGYFMWLKLRESDVLKYEFITTATHKFRTPLTHIKWAVENLEKARTPEEQSIQLGYIRFANAKLVELTNLLVNVSGAEETEYQYRFEQKNISIIATDVITSLTSQFEMKHLQVTQTIESNCFAVCEESRIRFIMQTLIENGINYTSEHGSISVVLRTDDKNVIFSVTDSGIGIPKQELPLIFTKFYRGEQARLSDTEGMGIGLYIAKEIIARHNGKIWAESDGANKGSTFSFSIPRIHS